MLDPETPRKAGTRSPPKRGSGSRCRASSSTTTAWGMRKLAYEIQQRTEADYRFFRFETEEGCSTT